MDDKLEKLVTTYGDKLYEYLQVTEEFVVEQTPLLVQEILVYSFWYNLILGTFWLLISLLIPVIGFRISKALQKNKEKVIDLFDKDAPDFFSLLSLVIGSILGVFSLGVSGWFGHYLEALQIKVAPRMWLLEYLGDLVT